MIKKILLLAMTIAVTYAGAQTFQRVHVNYGAMDHITLNAGISLTFNTPLFTLNGPIDAISSEITPGHYFLLNTYSSHGELNNYFSSGIEFNVQYLKSHWNTTLSSATVYNPNYDYHYMGKYNEVGFSIGVVFSFQLTDNFDIAASVGLGFGFLHYGLEPLC